MNEQKKLQLAIKEKEFELIKAQTTFEEKKKRGEDMASGDINFTFGPNFQKTIEQRDKAKEDTAKFTRELIELYGELEDEEEKTSGNRLSVARAFRDKYLDLQKTILSAQEEMAKSGIKNEITLLEIEEDSAQKEIQLRKDTFIEREKIRLDTYLMSIKGKENEAEMAADANAKFKKMEEDAEIELGEAKIAIRDNYGKKIIDKEIEIIEALNRLKADSAVRIAMDFDADGDETLNNIQEEIIAKANKKKKESLQEVLDNAMNGDNPEEILSAQIELDTFETDMQISKEERDKNHFNKLAAIRKEYVGFLRTTGSILNNLAGDNEAMQKAALIINKGAASADVIIKAQQANVAHNAAYATRGITAITPAQVAANNAKLAKDKLRTNIGAGLAIANIWSAGMNSRSNPSSGGSGGGGGRTFDFNLVGSTGQNQLAQATAGQLDQPVQAYVVSSNITSTQQLESQIQSDATFGED